jgi:glycosyltransferase involved in cell wall biosynthesis
MMAFRVFGELRDCIGDDHPKTTLGLGHPCAGEIVRIGILTQYYPPEIGAPQARLSNLAGHLVDRGHEVHVLTAMPNYPQGRVYPGYGGLFRREDRGGVSIIRSYVYPATGLGGRRLVNYFSFVLSSALVGTFAIPRLDYLITESPPLFLGISGYLLSRLKRARWIFNVSDLWLESAVQLGALREGLVFRTARALENFCYRNAWCVSGQSREILSEIGQQQPQVRMYHLSNGVATESFGPDLASDETRDQLAPGKATIAVYAGLHGYAQGLENVLEAAALLRDVDSLSIVLIGDGPEKQALMERARSERLDNVRFLDAAPRERMPSFLSSADIALVPLKERLFGAVPSKLYEAMGAGLPVVLMTGGEAETIVRESGAGVVVPPGDVPALASAIRRLAEDPEERRAMGARGRDAALTRFDRKAIGDAFIDYLERQGPC